MVQEIAQQTVRDRALAYDRWMWEQDIPVYGGHSVADPMVLELKPWHARECNAAFIQLEGQQGVSEARITEIPPGASLPPLKLAVSEVVYVLEGQGLTTVWAGAGPKETFEWQKSSLFCLPRHCWHQLSNATGTRPARILNYNYLPVAMSALPDPSLVFNNPYEEPERLYGRNGDRFYAEAKVMSMPERNNRHAGQGAYWTANFIPDMSAWDKLIPLVDRGAGGSVVYIRFPGAEMSCHMSVFEPQLYKKAHKHGPGRVIVIPKGEGYSVLSKGGPFMEPLTEAERAVCPWSEGSIFVPPENWYHQHFNSGAGEARYLALGPLPQFSGNPYRHQIEYTDEDPWVRRYFESQLAAKGIKTLMPDECYTDPDFVWGYGDDD